LIDSVHGKVLFVTIIPVVLFFIIAKFDLGMATDWDITAPYLFLINLIGVFTFFNMKREYGFKILFLFFAITLLNSIVWFNINATVDPNINRKKVLGNSRMISREGYYLGTYHLTMYYYHNDDIPSMIQSWEQYIQHYPSDGRAYQKSIQLLIDGENLDADRIINLFERWLHAAPEDIKAKSEYANFCLDEGNRSMTLGKINDAERQFQRAIELNPSLVHAYNNLGVILGKIGQYDRAIEMYKKAIALDSNYIRAYENLGKAFAHEGVDTTAIEMFKKYIQLSPASPRGYENLAMMYYKIGDRAKSIDNLNAALRLGSSLAQKFLAEKKIAR
jgi:tetratricopeptide (TPR) repeat protein